MRLGNWAVEQKNKLVDSKEDILVSGEFKSMASLDPRVALYWVAAQEVLEKLKLRDALQLRCFFVADVREMQWQVREGSIDIAFIALIALNPSKKIEGSS